MILFTVSTVEAYSKQIIFDTFKDKESADAAFEKLKNDKVYKQLTIIAKENDFSVHVTDDNKLVAEPIKNQFIQEATLHLMKSHFAQESVVDKETVSTTTSAKYVASDTMMSSERVYPRKIILGTFSEENGASLLFEEFKKDEAYPKLIVLAKENDFVVHTRTLGVYNILIAEPIKNESVYTKVMELIAPRFADAYSLSNPGSPNVVIEDESSVLAEPAEAISESVGVEADQEITKEVVVSEQNISALSSQPLAEDIQADANRTAPIVEEVKYTLEALETKVVAPEASSNSSHTETEELSFIDSIFKLLGFSSEPAVATENAVENSHVAQEKETKAIENNITENVPEKKTEEKKVDATVATPETIEEESSYLSYIWLLLLGIIVAVAVYFFRKFKGVYDTY
jgi:hypothetical protein